MSSRPAVLRPLTTPPIADVVDSIAESASAKLRAFDEHSANSTHIDLPAQKANSFEALLQPASQPSSIGRKAGALAIVAVVHIVAVVVLAQMAPQFHEAPATPLQVVMIDAPLAARDTPPPPPPKQLLPELAQPVEPVINIATPEPVNAISVAVRPNDATPTTSGSTSAPKMVSSVEYVREPIAKYPAAARALKQRGTVTLRALIDHTGHAREVDVHRSSGFRLLDDTARQAVLRALFKPYSENGHSIPVYVLIPIEFGAAG